MNTQILEFADEFDNYVIVKAKEDFPAPSQGVITLNANTLYAINGVVNIGTDRIEAGGDVKIQGLSAFTEQIIYTGTGNMFTVTDHSFVASNVTFTSTGVGSQTFNSTNNTKDKNFVVQNAVFAGCVNIGTVTGFDNVLLNVITYISNQSGWTFDGVKHLFLTSQNFEESNLGVFVDIKNGTFELAKFVNNVFHADGAATGLQIDPASITVTNNFIVSSCSFYGTGAPHAGFTVNNSHFVVRGNSGLSDFRAGASMTMTANVTETLNVPASTWTKIAGTTAISNDKRFSMPQNNRLQYDGNEDINCFLTFNLAGYYTSGAARIAQISIHKNGVLESGSINAFTIYGADEPCGSGLETTMSNGDYIEVFFQKFGGAASDDYVFSYLNVQIEEV